MDFNDNDNDNPFDGKTLGEAIDFIIEQIDEVMNIKDEDLITKTSELLAKRVSKTAEYRRSRKHLTENFEEDLAALVGLIGDTTSRAEHSNPMLAGVIMFLLGATTATSSSYVPQLLESVRINPKYDNRYKQVGHLVEIFEGAAKILDTWYHTTPEPQSESQPESESESVASL